MTPLDPATCLSMRPVIDVGTSAMQERDAWNRWSVEIAQMLGVSCSDFTSDSVADQYAELRERLRTKLESLKKDLDDTKRHLQNIYQDRYEGAYCEASVADAFRQALASINPEHPALKGAPPSFGVWESLIKHAEELRVDWLDEVRRSEKLKVANASLQNESKLAASALAKLTDEFNKLQTENAELKLYKSRVTGFSKQFADKIEELNAAKNEIARLNGQTRFFCTCGGVKLTSGLPVHNS